MLSLMKQYGSFFVIFLWAFRIFLFFLFVYIFIRFLSGKNKK